jgi:hypothetical protein
MIRPIVVADPVSWSRTRLTARMAIEFRSRLSLQSLLMFAIRGWMWIDRSVKIE